MIGPFIPLVGVPVDGRRWSCGQHGHIGGDYCDFCGVSLTPEGQEITDNEGCNSDRRPADSHERQTPV